MSKMIYAEAVKRVDGSLRFDEGQLNSVDEEALAVLRSVEPLVSAVEKAQTTTIRDIPPGGSALSPWPIKRIFVGSDQEPILRAALALRETMEGKEKQDEHS